MVEQNKSPPDAAIRKADDWQDSWMSNPTKVLTVLSLAGATIVVGSIAADLVWLRPKAQKSEQDAVTFFLTNQNGTSSSSGSGITEKQLRDDLKSFATKDDLKSVRQDVLAAIAARPAQIKQPKKAEITPKQ